MQKCYNCGKEVDDSVLICPDCGALVRRYTAPASAQEQEQESVFPAEAPAEQAAHAQRLPAAARVWLIVMTALAAWSFFTYGSFLYVQQNAELLHQALEQGMSFGVTDMAVLEIVMQMVSDYLWAYVLLMVLSFVKACLCIWFLIGHRKPAVYCTLAVSAALFLTAALSGCGVVSVLFLADAALAVLLLRGVWTQLR